MEKSAGISARIQAGTTKPGSKKFGLFVFLVPFFSAAKIDHGTLNSCFCWRRYFAVCGRSGHKHTLKWGGGVFTCGDSRQVK